MTLVYVVLAMIWTGSSVLAAGVAGFHVMACGFAWAGKLKWGDEKPVRTTVFSVLFLVLLLLNAVQGFQLAEVLGERFKLEQQLQVDE